MNSNIKKILKLKKIKHAAKLMLIIINEYADAKGDCEIDIPKVVSAFDIAKTTVFQELKFLEEYLYLSKRKDGKRSIYRINFERFE